jgi:hypothetical protein
MTIEQTVEIPASRRVTFDLPLSFPVGRANAALVVFPAAEAAQAAPINRAPVEQEPALSAPAFSAPPRMTAREAIEASRGIAKRLGATLTVDRFLELRHEETKREEAEYRRLFHHEDQV